MSSILKIRDENGNFIDIPAIKGDKGKSAFEQAVEGGYKGAEEEFIQILNGVSLEGKHIYDKDNPHNVTAEQVGSLKIYNGFKALNSELGTAFNGATPIETIIEAMPNNTGLKADIAIHPSAYPTRWGILTIYKIRETRVEVEYVSNAPVGDADYNKKWIGQYNAGVFGGFVEVYTKQNITAGTEDLVAGVSQLRTGSIYFVYE